MVIERKDGSIICTLSKEEFVGIFRTIGGTNAVERKTDKEIRLTNPENRAVSEAYVSAFTQESAVKADRK